MLMSEFRGRSGARQRRDAHVIVCGNEKGGSGMTTLAMHMAVALMKLGYQVATVDLDGRQLSFTRYVQNRRKWAAKVGVPLDLPVHFSVPPVRRDSLQESEGEEFRRLAEGLAGIEKNHDFVVVDTPGSDTYLNRLAHRIADTLVTPMNDSFVDLDVLARIDPVSLDILELSQYAGAVRDARRERRRVDNAVLDWIVVRNRLSNFASRNERRVSGCLHDLSMQLGFRVADGISERVVFREFFPNGLTALDEFHDQLLGTRPTLSHLAARQEIRQLLAALRLPTDAEGQRRVEARRTYAEATRKPIDVPDIFAG